MQPQSIATPRFDSIAAPGHNASIAWVPWRDLALLLLVAFGVRLLFLLLSDNDDGDAFARILLARRVVDEGLLVPTDVWLPAHFWLLAVPYAVGLHGDLWPRLLTAVAGATTVLLVARLAERVFGCPAALGTGVLLALNPLHVRFSIVTVSEVFMLCFLSLGLVGFLAYIKRGTVPALLAGALAFNLACGQRLEAWIVLLVVPLAYVVQHVRRHRKLDVETVRRVALFLAASSVFALWWFAYSAFRWGDGLHIAALNTERVLADPTYQKGWYTVAFWPMVLLAALGPFALALGIDGVAGAFRARRARLFPALFLGFLGLYYAQNARSAMITDARYGLLLVWFLILCAGWSLAARRVPLRVVGAISAIWLLAVAALGDSASGVVGRKFASISPRPHFERGVHAIDDWLRAHPSDDGIVVGPMRRYGPWMTLFDQWHHGSVTLARTVADVPPTRPGYWIVETSAVPPAVLRDAPTLVSEVDGFRLYRHLDVADAGRNQPVRSGPN